jgi:hypothetical protein
MHLEIDTGVKLFQGVSRLKARSEKKLKAYLEREHDEAEEPFKEVFRYARNGKYELFTLNENWHKLIEKKDITKRSSLKGKFDKKGKGEGKVRAKGKSHSIV